MCSADLATDVDLLSVLPFTLFTDILEKRDRDESVETFKK